MSRSQTILDLYQMAEEAICEAGYAWEIEWQRNRAFETFSEQDLLRESAWVILCSGFRESSVRRCFDVISLCFCDWESAEEISHYKEQCVSTALSAFRHQAKINAIAQVSDRVHGLGFVELQARIFDDPISRLQELPYIGPVTSWHLAKNLGLNVAKNDRHLSRLAQDHGYSDAHDLCEFISNEIGEPSSVVDVVLWRFAAMSREHKRSSA